MSARFIFLLLAGSLCLLSKAYRLATLPSATFAYPPHLKPLHSLHSSNPIPTISKEKVSLILLSATSSASPSSPSSSSSSAVSSSSSSSFPPYTSNDAYTEKVTLTPGLVLKLLSNLYVRVSSEVAQQLFGNYSLSLIMRPVLTKAVSSCIGFIIGDLLAQSLLGGGGRFNVVRCLRMGLFGGLIHGPLGHFFYSFLEKKLPGSSPSMVTMKVLADQVLWSPTMSAILISFVGIVAGSSPSVISRNIGRLLSQAVLLSWMIWPIAHFANYRLVQPRQRLLYFNSVQIAYNALISMVVNRPFTF